MIESGKQTYNELFEFLMHKCDNNLDQLVQGDELVVPSGFGEEFALNLKAYLDKVVDEYKEKPADIENIIVPELKEHNGKFLEWVIAYFEAVTEPMRETAFLKGVDMKQLVYMVRYTMDRYVVSYSGDLVFDDQPEFLSLEELNVLKKLLLTVSDMIIVKNFSKEYFLKKVKETFDMDSSYAEVFWNEIIPYEAALWKLLVCRKLERLENRVKELSNLVEEEYT